MPPPAVSSGTADVHDIPQPTDVPHVSATETTVPTEEISVIPPETSDQAADSSVQPVSSTVQVSATETTVENVQADESVVEVPIDVLISPPSTSDDPRYMAPCSESVEINLQNLVGEETQGATGGPVIIPQTSTSVIATHTAVESTSSDDPEIAVKSEYRTSHSRHR